MADNNNDLSETGLDDKSVAMMNIGFCVSNKLWHKHIKEVYDKLDERIRNCEIQASICIKEKERFAVASDAYSVAQALIGGVLRKSENFWQEGGVNNG